MRSSFADLVLAEVGEHDRPTTDPGLDALRKAILLEDSLGLRLSDEQIDLIAVEGLAAIRDIVAGAAPS